MFYKSKKESDKAICELESVFKKSKEVLNQSNELGKRKLVHNLLIISFSYRATHFAKFVPKFKTFLDGSN